MAIKADYHLHSVHSEDSETPIEETVKAAISLGLEKICFTEHVDHGFPVTAEHPEGSWVCNIDSYLYDLLTIRQKYEDQIQIGFGVELGLQESVFRENALTAKSHEYDFIIGSIHLVNGLDTYWPSYFEGKTTKQAVTEYLKCTLTNIRKFQNFDVLGHMDYIVRTLPEGEGAYKVSDYTDLFDEILETLIENEKGIEINTSQLCKGFSNPNPHRELVKRYKELGGEIITIGSDAHTPDRVAAHFDVAETILKDCGFKYYTTFENRVANYNKLI